jgi:hypothetical protein
MYFGVSDKAEKGTFERASSSFFYLICAVFTPPFTAVTTWQDERKLIRKEVNQSVYSLDLVFWAKTLVTFPVEMSFNLMVCPGFPSHS